VIEFKFKARSKCSSCGKKDVPCVSTVCELCVKRMLIAFDEATRGKDGLTDEEREGIHEVMSTNGRVANEDLAQRLVAADLIWEEDHGHCFKLTDKAYEALRKGRKAS